MYKSRMMSQVPVAHACNSSNSGGRDQEDRGLKPAPGKQFKRPYIQKKPITEKGWWSGSRGRPRVQTPVPQKEEEEEEEERVIEGETDQSTLYACVDLSQ
jgi:hypothetical protein